MGTAIQRWGWVVSIRVRFLPLFGAFGIETIRYYETIDLLPAPARTASGYRTYSDEHLRRLNFIQRARSLGFSSEQTRGLLDLTEAEGNKTRADVKSLTEAHIDEISQKIKD